MLKMTVTNKMTKETAKVTVKLYHTNQTIHLQGGRKMGTVPSVSILADCLEKHWNVTWKNSKESIKELNESLKNMEIKEGRNL